MVAPLVTGIDIGHHSLRAVTLKHTSKGYELLGCNEIVLDSPIVSENHVVNHQEIVKSFKRLKKKLPLFRRDVSLAVPDSTVISKMLHLEAGIEPRELEFAVQQAFAQQSPLPIEDLSLDYVQMEDQQSGSTQGFQVVATRRDVVDSRVSALESVGLKPMLVDVQTHALYRLWQQVNFQHPEKPRYGFLEVGQQMTSLLIEQSNRAPFHKDIPFGLAHRDVHSGELDDSAQNPEDVFVSEMVDKVKRQIQLYTSMNQKEVLRGLWLSGDGATEPGLAEALNRMLHIEIEVLNPLMLLEAKGSVKKKIAMPEQYSVATGLAISGIEWMENQDAL